MNIRDAKPGDVLRDKDGDAWVVWGEGAYLAFAPGDEHRADATYSAPILPLRKVESFGPFTRLVPEREGK